MAWLAALFTAGAATVHPLPGRTALLPASAHWVRRCGPTRLQEAGAAAIGDGQWDAAADPSWDAGGGDALPAAGWDAAPWEEPALAESDDAQQTLVATGAQSEEAGPIGGGWADDGGWEDSWSEEDGDPASSWLQPKSAQSPPPAPRRPIEAVTVGMVTGPFARRNGYHVEVRVQHTQPKRESTHRLFVSNEVLIETAKLKGYEQWDLGLGPFAEAVISYLQQQGVALEDPDWGMQDETIPYSHEQVTVRTLFGYYPELKAHLAETLIPIPIPTDHDSRPWGRDAWGEHTPRPDHVGLEAEEEAKAWIVKREEAVARFRSGGPQVLPRDEEVAPAGSLSWDKGRGSPSSWEAGSAAIFDAAEAASAAAKQ